MPRDDRAARASEGVQDEVLAAGRVREHPPNQRRRLHRRVQVVVVGLVDSDDVCIAGVPELLDQLRELGSAQIRNVDLIVDDRRLVQCTEPDVRRAALPGVVNSFMLVVVVRAAGDEPVYYPDKRLGEMPAHRLDLFDERDRQSTGGSGDVDGCSGPKPVVNVGEDPRKQGPHLSRQITLDLECLRVAAGGECHASQVDAVRRVGPHRIGGLAFRHEQIPDRWVSGVSADQPMRPEQVEVAASSLRGRRRCGVELVIRCHGTGQ